MSALVPFFLKVLFSICTAPIFFNVGGSTTIHQAIPAGAEVVDIPTSTQIVLMSIQDVDTSEFILAEGENFYKQIIEYDCREKQLCVNNVGELTRKMTSGKSYKMNIKALDGEKKELTNKTIVFTYNDCKTDCNLATTCSYNKEPVKACGGKTCTTSQIIKPTRNPFCIFSSTDIANPLTPEQCKAVGGTAYYSPYCLREAAVADECNKVLASAGLKSVKYEYSRYFTKYSCDCTGCNDMDGDGYGTGCSLGADCNDTVYEIHPAATEVCDDGIDNNCNNLPDCMDAQCAGSEKCVFNCGNQFPYFGKVESLMETTCSRYFDPLKMLQYSRDSMNLKCALTDASPCPKTFTVRFETKANCPLDARVLKSASVYNPVTNIAYFPNTEGNTQDFMFSNTIGYYIPNNQVLVNGKAVALYNNRLLLTYDQEYIVKADCQKADQKICAGTLLGNGMTESNTKAMIETSSPTLCRQLLPGDGCRTSYQATSAIRNYQQCEVTTNTAQKMFDAIVYGLYRSVTAVNQEGTKSIVTEQKATLIQRMITWLRGEKVYAMDSLLPKSLLLVIEKDVVNAEMSKQLREMLDAFLKQKGSVARMITDVITPLNDETKKKLQEQVGTLAKEMGGSYNLVYIGNLAGNSTDHQNILDAINAAAMYSSNLNLYYPIDANGYYCDAATVPCMIYGKVIDFSLNGKTGPVPLLGDEDIILAARFANVSQTLSSYESSKLSEGELAERKIYDSLLQKESLIQYDASKQSRTVDFEGVYQGSNSFFANIRGGIKDLFKSALLVFSGGFKSYALDVSTTSASIDTIGDGICGYTENRENSPNDCGSLYANKAYITIYDEKGNQVASQEESFDKIYVGQMTPKILLTPANKEKLKPYTNYYATIVLGDENNNRTNVSNQIKFYKVNCEDVAGVADQANMSRAPSQEMMKDIVMMSPPLIEKNIAYAMVLTKDTNGNLIVRLVKTNPSEEKIEYMTTYTKLGEFAKVDPKMWKLRIVDIDSEKLTVTFAMIAGDTSMINIYQLSPDSEAKLLESRNIKSMVGYRKWAVIDDAFFVRDTVAQKSVPDDKITETLRSNIIPNGGGKIKDMLYDGTYFYFLMQKGVFRLDPTTYSVSSIAMPSSPDISNMYRIWDELNNMIYVAYGDMNMGSSYITLMGIGLTDFSMSRNTQGVINTVNPAKKLSMFLLNGSPAIYAYVDSEQKIYKYNVYNLAKNGLETWKNVDEFKGQNITIPLQLGQSLIVFNIEKSILSKVPFAVNGATDDTVDIVSPAIINPGVEYLAKATVKTNTDAKILLSPNSMLMNSTNSSTFNSSLVISTAGSYDVSLLVNRNVDTAMLRLGCNTPKEIKINRLNYIDVSDTKTQGGIVQEGEGVRLLTLTDGSVLVNTFMKPENTLKQEAQKGILANNDYKVFSKDNFIALKDEVNNEIVKKRVEESLKDNDEIVVREVDPKNPAGFLPVYAMDTKMTTPLKVFTDDQEKKVLVGFEIPADTAIDAIDVNPGNPCTIPLLNYARVDDTTKAEAMKATKEKIVLGINVGTEGCAINFDTPVDLVIESDVLPTEGLKVFKSEDMKTWIQIPEANILRDGTEVIVKASSFSYYALGGGTTTTTTTTPTTSHGGGIAPYDADACTLTTTNKTPCANNDGIDGKGIDYSASYYDKTCCSAYELPAQDEEGAVCTAYTSDFNAGYAFAFNAGITTMTPCTKARLNDNITRAELAKVLVVFARNILKMQNAADVRGCNDFEDVDGVTDDLKSYIVTACEMGIMGIHTKYPTQALTNFMPTDLVSRAHLTTTTSRLVRGNQFDGGELYRKKHMENLKSQGIIENMDPTIKERRGWVFIMLQKIASLSE